MNSLNDDIVAEERGPEEIIEIPGSLIHESLVKTWWEDFVKSATYKLLTQNCAQVVQKALETGGFTHFADFAKNIHKASELPWWQRRFAYEAQVTIYKGHNHGTNDITPADVLKWVKYFIEEKQRFAKQN